MENVSGFKTLDGGKFKDAVINELKAVGYTNLEWKMEQKKMYKRAEGLNIVKKLRKEVGFIVGVLKDAFAEGKKK